MDRRGKGLVVSAVVSWQREAGISASEFSDSFRKIKRRAIWYLCAGNDADRESAGQGSRFTVEKGTKLLAVLESDGMFLNDCDYTVRCPEVRELIRKALEWEEDKQRRSVLGTRSGRH